MIATSLAARLQGVGAIDVAKWVLDCLQLENTWMADLEEASSLVQHIVALSWLTFC